MIKLDHLTIPVRDHAVARDWYVEALGLRVEFEVNARGVAFAHPPQKTYWGYGAELVDPDGYRVRLWDETTMRDR